MYKVLWQHNKREVLGFTTWIGEHHGQKGQQFHTEKKRDSCGNYKFGNTSNYSIYNNK